MGRHFINHTFKGKFFKMTVYFSILNVCNFDSLTKFYILKKKGRRQITLWKRSEQLKQGLIKKKDKIFLSSSESEQFFFKNVIVMCA